MAQYVLWLGSFRAEVKLGYEVSKDPTIEAVGEKTVLGEEQ